MIHTHRMRSLVAILAVAAVPAVGLVTPSSAASGCPTGWGSLPETSSRTTTAQLTGVRSGRHTCFDRLVIDLSGRPAGYRVNYVSNVFTDGSGALVPLRGGAKLQIVVTAPNYHLTANQRELTNVAGYQTFRQVAWAGSFEGQSTIGLGVRARLPFRVLTLPGPGAGSRLVVDVAHRW